MGSTSLLAEHIKIQTKKHKLAMYRNLYKDAIVSIDSTKLNVAVDNKELNEGPFPLKLDGDFAVTENKTGWVTKLPSSVLPNPKYYKFVWNTKSSEDQAAADKLCKQLMKHGAPALDKATR